MRDVVRMIAGILRPVLPALVALALLHFAGRPAHSAPAPAEATDTLRLTVDGAVAYALEHGTEMRFSRSQVQWAGGRVREAMSYALPQVNGNLTLTQRFDSIFRGTGAEADTGLLAIFSQSPFGSERQWDVEVTASELLSLRVGSGISAAHAVRRSSEADSRQVEGDVAQNVRRAYYQAATAQAALAIAESSLVLARQQLRQVEQLYAQGSRAEYDLLRSRVDASNQEPPVVRAENAVAVAMLELKRAINVPADRPVVLASDLRLDEQRVPVVGPAPSDGSARPALERARADVDARRHLLSAAKGARWPELVLSGTMTHSAFPPSGFPAQDDFRRNLEASAKLQVPLFLGGRTLGTVQQATAEYEQARLALERTQLDVNVEVEQARGEVDRALSTLVARRGTFQLALRAHTLAQSRYRNGLATQLEVSDARISASTAALNQVLAVRDYLIALGDLEHALGQPLALQFQDLDTISQTLPRIGR